MSGYQTRVPGDQYIAKELAKLGLRVDEVSRGLRGGVTPLVAQLAAGYRGAGLGTVTLDGGTTYSAVAEWAGEYVPWKSRLVHVARKGDGFVVLGHAAGRRERLAPATDWAAYNTRNVTDTYTTGEATLLPSGIVVLSGLIDYTPSAVPAANTLITVLPPDMRPDTDMLIYVSQSDTARAVRVLANGNVEVSSSGWTSGGYVSLDGIAFPAAGVATWTDIGSGGSSWGANFEAWTTGAWGTPAFWVDPFGITWFRGLVRVKVATSGDNTSICLLPAEARAYEEQHVRTVGNETYACVGARETDGLNWKTNSPGTVGQWISLANVRVITAAGDSGNPWESITWFANSWARHTTSFPVPATLRRGDGLVLSRGLISGGTVGSVVAFRVPEECQPRKRAILDIASNSARGRIDIAGHHDRESMRGGVTISQGNTAWASLDGLTWLPDAA